MQNRLIFKDLVKKGDYAAVKTNRSLINASNRERLLALAVDGLQVSAQETKPRGIGRVSDSDGRKTGFSSRLCSDRRAPIDIMNALIEAGAEQNIFTAAALGDVDRVRDLLSSDSTLANKTTDYDVLDERDMTALHYACRSELGKVNQAHADQLVLCACSLTRSHADAGRNSIAA